VKAYVLPAALVAGFLALVGWGLYSWWPRSMPEPDCTTPCGLRAYGTVDCAGLAAWELKATETLAAVKPWTEGGLCGKVLHGASVTVKPPRDGGYVMPVTERHSAGTVDDLTGSILVVGDDWKRNALCHEVCHLAESTLDLGGPAVEHGDWTARGIWTAIERCREVP